MRLLFKDGCFPPLHVGSVYVPPAGSPQLQSTSLDDRYASLQQLVLQGGASGTVILGGDFNSKVAVGVGSSSSDSLQCQGLNSHGTHMLNLCDIGGLSLCTGTVQGDMHAPPTYHATARSNPTRPDHVLVSSCLLPSCVSSEVQPQTLGSDHHPIHLVLTIPIVVRAHVGVQGTPLQAIHWASAARGPYVLRLQQRLGDIQACAASAAQGYVDQAVEALDNTLIGAAQAAGLRCKSRARRIHNSQSMPFYDEECRRLKREYRRLARRDGHTVEVRELERRYHSYVRAKKRAWLLQQLKSATQQFYGDSRRFWQQFRGPAPRLPGPLCDHGAWREYMGSLAGTNLEHPPSQPAPLSHIAYPILRNEIEGSLNEPFTIEEVEVALGALNTGRANGFSGYPAELLRYAQDYAPPGEGAPPHLLGQAVTDIFNAMLRTGRIPPRKNVLTVTPVVKDAGGDILNPSNYRPIAVPEPLMRLYASIIDSRLVGYLEREGLRCDAQTGFRPGFSTLHNILTLQHFIDRSSATQPLYCCFLDLSKAYDRVPRTLLWEVLRRLGVGGSFSQAIRSLYDGAQLTMVIEGTSGPIHPATIGLTQGSPLSPTLFGVFADGLIRFVQDRCPDVGPTTVDGLRVPILAYADDFVLLATSPKDLQRLLDVVAEWCAMVGMLVNPTKTVTMCFPEMPIPEPHPSYNGVALQIVSKFRYLGVYLSSSIGIGETFQHLHHRMQGSWALMTHRYRNLRSAASVGLLRRLFLACVVPSGSYACEVWGFRSFPPASHSHSKASITTAYLSMLRQLAGVRPTVATPILLEELSVQQVEDIWLKRAVTFWNSITRLPENHLYARVARGDCFLGVTSHTPTWAGSFMQALVRVGYPYLIDAHHLHPVVWGAVRTLLCGRAQGPWEGLHVAPSLCPSRRAQLCTYSRWLRRPAHVPRLTLFDLIVDARRLRVFLRFRMGVHGLPIDVGRWRGVPRSHRTCDMCDTGAVGDEHHFVFVCPALAAVRTHYAPLFALRSRTLRAFVWQPDLLLVVRYIYDCFQVRARILNPCVGVPSNQPPLAGLM